MDGQDDLEEIKSVKNLHCPVWKYYQCGKSEDGINVHIINDLKQHAVIK